MRNLFDKDAYKNHIHDDSKFNNAKEFKTGGEVDGYQPAKLRRVERAMRDVRVTGDAGRKRNAPEKNKTGEPIRFLTSSGQKRPARSAISTKIGGQRKSVPKAVSGAQHKHAGNAHSIKLHSIDKLILDLELKGSELDDVVDQLKSLVTDKQIRRITNQSSFWKFVFFLKFDDHRASRFTKNVGVTFQCLPIGKNAKIKMQIVLNPALMDEQQVATFMQVWKTIFPARHHQMVARCRVCRLDEAIDVEVALDDLIVELGGALVSARYYTKTDRGGRIETMYTGGIESEHHGAAYNQGTADVFKNEAGLAVPLNAETADHTFVTREGCTRIESRRLFKDAPLTIAEMLLLPSAMSEYQVLDLTRLRPRDRDHGFVAYLDCVRLRGLRGARLHMLAQFKNSKAVKTLVADYEKCLSVTGAEWWSAVDHNRQMSVMLQAAPIWRFLRHAKPAQNRWRAL
jgi:hypothetical protein